MPSIHLSIRLSVFPQLKESLIEIVQYLAPIVNLAECDSQNQSVLHAVSHLFPFQYCFIDKLNRFYLFIILNINTNLWFRLVKLALQKY